MDRFIERPVYVEVVYLHARSRQFKQLDMVEFLRRQAFVIRRQMGVACFELGAGIGLFAGREDRRSHCRGGQGTHRGADRRGTRRSGGGERSATITCIVCLVHCGSSFSKQTNNNCDNQLR